jgi:hypothetical protein
MATRRNEPWHTVGRQIGWLRRMEIVSLWFCIVNFGPFSSYRHSHIIRATDVLFSGTKLFRDIDLRPTSTISPIRNRIR